MAGLDPAIQEKECSVSDGRLKGGHDEERLPTKNNNEPAKEAGPLGTELACKPRFTRSCFILRRQFSPRGLALRVWQYARTPVPLKIPTTPAPVTRAGAAFRVLREVTVFESLFKSNKWIWLFGWVFHVSLALVLFRHLRYFTQPVWSLVALMQPFGVYAGFAMVAALFALWVRRVTMARMRYISDAFDHLVLLLLIAIGASGLAMKFVEHTDIVSVKGFILGLMAFDWQLLPADPLLLTHWHSSQC